VVCSRDSCCRNCTLCAIFAQSLGCSLRTIIHANLLCLLLAAAIAALPFYITLPACTPQIREIEKGYYADGEDAYDMKLQLYPNTGTIGSQSSSETVLADTPALADDASVASDAGAGDAADDVPTSELAQLAVQ
jgi:hypothetical protein